MTGHWLLWLIAELSLKALVALVVTFFIVVYCWKLGLLRKETPFDPWSD